MPTYDYHCDACGHQFEAFQSMKDDALTMCPQCARDALRRIITGGAGVIFKGSGFYVNDSKSGGAAKTTPKKTSDSSDTSGASDTATTGSDTSRKDSGNDAGSSSKSGEKKTA
jgi:putative FmdB family regulatory protein